MIRRLASVVAVVVVVLAPCVVLAFQPPSGRSIAAASQQYQARFGLHQVGSSQTARWQNKPQAQHGEICLNKSARSWKVSMLMLNNKEQGSITSDETLGQNESDGNSNRSPQIHDDGLLRNWIVEDGGQRGKQGLGHSHFQQNGAAGIKQKYSRLRTLKQKLARFFLAFLAARRKKLVIPRGGRRQSLSVLRKRIATVAFAIALAMGSFLTPPTAWAGVSGGRMGGGSFNRQSSSPSRSRPMGGGGRTTTMPRPPPSSYGRVHHMPSPRVHTHFHVGPRLPPVIIDRGWHAGDPRIVVSQPRVRVKDIVILTGTGALLAYGFRNNYRQNISDAAGAREGTTVGSLTVALEVRRDKHDNILGRFTRLANVADTSSQRGLQELLSNVAPELLRNEKSITSARAQSKNYASRSQAEREFQLLSVQGRSKVDRLTVNKFGSQDRPDARKVSNDDSDFYFSTTMAIVTLTFAMEGDASTQLPRISTRDDLRRALNQISADAVVSNCLLTAEILWLPEDSSETLSRDEIYADYPDLVPL